MTTFSSTCVATSRCIMPSSIEGTRQPSYRALPGASPFYSFASSFLPILFSIRPRPTWVLRPDRPGSTTNNWRWGGRKGTILDPSGFSNFVFYLLVQRGIGRARGHSEEEGRAEEDRVRHWLSLVIWPARASCLLYLYYCLGVNKHNRLIMTMLDSILDLRL